MKLFETFKSSMLADFTHPSKVALGPFNEKTLKECKPVSLYYGALPK